jgi:hypothetical protein
VPGKTGAGGNPHDQNGPAFLASVLLWQFLHGTVNLRISRPLFPWPPLADTVTTAVNRILDDAANRPAPPAGDDHEDSASAAHMLKFP